jgi:short-subunit dehydrogenase
MVQEYGRLDYMFNNAGTAVTSDARDLNLEHWRRVVDVNLWGVIHGTMAAYPVMVKQSDGHIVNTASMFGLVPYPTNVPYAATKHAVVGLSTSLRAEAADLGVKVSVACPGFVQTNIYQAATMVNLPRDKVIAKIPFRIMDVSKVARAILRGVSRNRAIITFPLHALLAWWLYRLHPALTDRMALNAIRALRGLREKT